MKKVIILLVALIGMISAMAQWVPLNSGTGNNLRSVHFIDADNGFAVGENGTIIKTTDGGTTWNNQVSGAWQTLNDVFMINTSNCFAVGAADVSTATILNTDDGSSWHSMSIGSFGSLESVCFADNNIGYAAGSFGYSWYSWSTAFKTTNGGITWSSIVQIPGQGGDECYSVSFTSVDTGYFLRKLIAGGDVFTEFRKTTDGGDTWNVSGFPFDYQASDVCFADMSTGYAIGNGLLKTTDGGNTWTASSSVGGNSIFFINENTGYIASTYYILGTINGGIDWTIQYYSEPSISLNSIFFVDENTGYVVGDGGTVLKTTNGGAVGLNEKGVVSQLLKIYPNPTIDKITISSPSITGNTQLSIFTVSGEKVLERQLTDNETQIDISALPRGVYFVRVQDEKWIEVGKIIKQ
jgi:photosystem II stability/assembly factor-like uncharacterized protein